MQQAVADGVNLIQQQGDAGLDRISKSAWGNRLVHNSYSRMFAIAQRRALRPACGLLSREQPGAAGLAAKRLKVLAGRLASVPWEACSRPQ